MSKASTSLGTLDRLSLPFLKRKKSGMALGLGKVRESAEAQVQGAREKLAQPERQEKSEVQGQKSTSEGSPASLASSVSASSSSPSVGPVTPNTPWFAGSSTVVSCLHHWL